MSLIPFDSMKYHATSEEIYNLVVNRTQSTISSFFRISIAFHLTRMASMMNTKVHTKDRGTIPVNGYFIDLAKSGTGKGASTNFIEEHLTNGFREVFLDSTFPSIAEKNLRRRAEHTYLTQVNSDLSPDEVEKKLFKEFDDLGDLPFDYDSGTTPAFKQVRHKCLLAKAGALNFFVDEIGTNLLSNSDLLGTYLQAYDVGKIKQKLIKNTAENKRLKEIDGRTPCNMLLFGTPDKLLDGGKIEEEFISMLETGYARRCFFGFSPEERNMNHLTPEELYDRADSNTDNIISEKLSKKFKALAHESFFNKVKMFPKDVNLTLIEYRQLCEDRAAKLPDHKFIHKAELMHRYFKSMKLAGAYAFIDGTSEVTEEQLFAAIKLAEDSGKDFQRILAREKPHIKLAKFIGSYEGELTKSDLVEELPCYKGTEAAKKDMMTLAISYGFRNNIIITEKQIDGIDFYKGETLKETNLNEILISYSKDITTGYINEKVPFDKLPLLLTQPAMHFTSHHLTDGYRDNAHVLNGFNLVIFDIDNGNVTPDLVNLLFYDTKYILYTTKRHTEESPRFRLIFPISHALKLTESDFKELMNNLYDWLPFSCDTQTNQRSRKWLTNAGKLISNDGELLDITPFIPKTKEAIKRKEMYNTTVNMSALERWFINNTKEGNRSNQLIKYAYALVDSNKSIGEIQSAVLSLNSKLDTPLPELEILKTIMVSVSNKLKQKEQLNVRQ